MWRVTAEWFAAIPKKTPAGPPNFLPDIFFNFFFGLSSLLRES